MKVASTSGKCEIRVPLGGARWLADWLAGRGTVSTTLQVRDVSLCGLSRRGAAEVK